MKGIGYIYKKKEDKVEFKYFKGIWQPVSSGGGKIKKTASVSWSETNSRTVSNAFTNGFSMSATVGFGTENNKVTLTNTVSSSYTRSIQNTISKTNGGSNTISCDALSCKGRLYQWTIAAKMFVNNREDGPEQVLQECNFVCVPSSIPTGPKCPKNFCGDLETDGGCQCCNANFLPEDKRPIAHICDQSIGLIETKAGSVKKPYNTATKLTLKQCKRKCVSGEWQNCQGFSRYTARGPKKLSDDEPGSCWWVSERHKLIPDTAPYNEDQWKIPFSPLIYKQKGSVKKPYNTGKKLTLNQCKVKCSDGEWENCVGFSRYTYRSSKKLANDALGDCWWTTERSQLIADTNDNEDQWHTA